jgi:glycosyltransferase involved in cell wall biosynthesis
VRILFPYLARWRSANRSRYHQLLTHLCALGHEVVVLNAPPIALDDISARDIAGAESELPSGMRLDELEVSASIRAFSGWFLPHTKLLKKGLIALSSGHQIRRLIHEHTIDVLLLYNLPQFRLVETVGCHVHFDLADDLVGMLSQESGTIAALGGLSAARRLLSRMVERAGTMSVASSVLQERVDRPAFLLPNGVDLNQIDRADGGVWNGRRPCAGFVGAFEYWIDFDLLLGVARQLPEVSFLLVGGGRRWAEIKSSIQRQGLKNVELTGSVPYRRAMDLAAAMDVCLLPFTRDAVSDAACPLKLFEYAALRKPVVSTTTLEVERIGRGWITFADTESSFADAVQTLMRDEARTAAQAAAGRLLVERLYTWPDLAGRFADYLCHSASLPGAESTLASKGR